LMYVATVDPIIDVVNLWVLFWIGKKFNIIIDSNIFQEKED
jgi:hypothetical protein